MEAVDLSGIGNVLSREFSNIGHTAVQQRNAALLELGAVIVVFVGEELGVNDTLSIHFAHEIQIGHVAVHFFLDLVFAVAVGQVGRGVLQGERQEGEDHPAVRPQAVRGIQERIVLAVSIRVLCSDQLAVFIGFLRCGGHVHAEFLQPFVIGDHAPGGAAGGTGHGIDLAVGTADTGLAPLAFADVGHQVGIVFNVLVQREDQAVIGPFFVVLVEFPGVNDVGQIAGGHYKLQAVGIVADRRCFDLQRDAGLFSHGRQHGVVVKNDFSVYAVQYGDRDGRIIRLRGSRGAAARAGRRRGGGGCGRRA